jgi:hypothetical protein
VRDIGPSRAPDTRVGDREPITDSGRVMWGLEPAVDYNSAPDIERVDPGVAEYGIGLLDGVEFPGDVEVFQHRRPKILVGHSFGHACHDI